MRRTILFSFNTLTVTVRAVIVFLLALAILIAPSIFSQSTIFKPDMVAKANGCSSANINSFHPGDINEDTREYGLIYQDAASSDPARWDCAAQALSYKVTAELIHGTFNDDLNRPVTPFKGWLEGVNVSLIMSSALLLGGHNKLTPTLDTLLVEVRNSYQANIDGGCGFSQGKWRDGNTCFDDYAVGTSGYAWIAAYEAKRCSEDPSRCGNIENFKTIAADQIRLALPPSNLSANESICIHKIGTTWTNEDDRGPCNGTIDDLVNNQAEIVSLNHGYQNIAYGLGLMTSISSAWLALQEANGIGINGVPLNLTEDQVTIAKKLFVEARRHTDGITFNNSDCYTYEYNEETQTYSFVAGANCEDAGIHYKPKMFPLKTFYERFLGGIPAPEPSPGIVSNYDFDAFDTSLFQDTYHVFSRGRQAVYGDFTREWYYSRPTLSGYIPYIPRSTIQGFKIDENNNQFNNPGATIEVGGITYGPSVNPYIFNGNSGSFVVTSSVPPGYTVSYSLCNNCISHPLESFVDGNIAFVNTPADGYSDLWWKYTRICTYSISPASETFFFDGGSGNVNVTANAGCSWNTSSSVSWISIANGSTGTGTGTVSYSVAPNPGNTRAGILTIAGQSLNITQYAGCLSSYSITPTNQTFTSSGGNSTVSVIVNPNNTDCTWNASSNASWISITNGNSGGGTGTVSYSVAPNIGAGPRTGTLTIAGQTFTVSQGLSCSYSISPINQLIPANGGSGNVTVTANSGCPWTATSNISWITITSGSSGNGSGTVSYSVAPNSSTSSRSGTMTIASQTFTVTQNGQSLPCTYSISPTSYAVNINGGNGLINVYTSPNYRSCSWIATSNVAWISIIKSSIGNGNGIVEYSVTANDNGSSRIGTITVANQTFTVTQDAAMPPDAALFVSQSVPGSIGTQVVTVSIRMRNVGTTTWTSDAGYRLQSENPTLNRIWGRSTVPLPFSVAPNSEVTFTFTVIVPYPTGNYNFQWRMSKDGNGFGDFTRNIEVYVPQ